MSILRPVGKSQLLLRQPWSRTGTRQTRTRTTPLTPRPWASPATRSSWGTVCWPGDVKPNNSGVTTVSLLFTFASHADKDHFNTIGRTCSIPINHCQHEYFVIMKSWSQTSTVFRHVWKLYFIFISIWYNLLSELLFTRRILILRVRKEDIGKAYYLLLFVKHHIINFWSLLVYLQSPSVIGLIRKFYCAILCPSSIRSNM